MTPGMTGFDLAWRRFYWTWRRIRPAAFIGGLGLSALAAAVLMLSAYFAGTAPHLPSPTALETLKTGEHWPPPIRSHSLDTGAAPSSAEAAPASISVIPLSADPSEAPPIDISDLPPPAARLR